MPSLTNNPVLDQCLEASKNFIHASFMIIFICSHTSPGIFHYMSSQLSLVWVFSRAHTFLQSLVKTYLGSSVYPETNNWILVVACLLVFALFCNLGLHLSSRWLHQRMECWCIWKDTYLYYVSSFPACTILVSHLICIMIFVLFIKTHN